MGNCLNSPTADDISLLRGNDNSIESSDALLGPPPPYEVMLFARMTDYFQYDLSLSVLCITTYECILCHVYGCMHVLS